jgi:hypothetical protein
MIVDTLTLSPKTNHPRIAVMMGALLIIISVLAMVVNSSAKTKVTELMPKNNATNRPTWPILEKSLTKPLLLTVIKYNKTPIPKPIPLQNTSVQLLESANLTNKESGLRMTTESMVISIHLVCSFILLTGNRRKKSRQ